MSAIMVSRILVYNTGLFNNFSYKIKAFKDFKDRIRSQRLRWSQVRSAESQVPGSICRSGEVFWGFLLGNSQ